MVVTGRDRREFTVADVAKEAGVSKAQAARALGEYGAVSDAVRSRVLAAAERLRYRPNELARSMNTGRSHTIGVVVGDIENPYFSLATRGISDAAEASGLQVVLINTGERLIAERAAVDILMDKRVDGLIVAPCSPADHAHLERVVRSGRPLVLLDRDLPGLDVDTAQTDVGPSAREAAELLLDLGHRRIGYVSTASRDEGAQPGSDLASPVAARIGGLVSAFADRGLTWDRESLLKVGLRGTDEISAAAGELLDPPEPVTAVVASDSLIGQVVIGVIQQKGLAIPTDVSVLMYDDLPWAQLLTPPLTVVAQPIYAIGHAAGTRLVARISGAHALPLLDPFPARLIRRGSVSSVERS